MEEKRGRERAAKSRRWRRLLGTLADGEPKAGVRSIFIASMAASGRGSEEAAHRDIASIAWKRRKPRKSGLYGPLWIGDNVLSPWAWSDGLGRVYGEEMGVGSWVICAPKDGPLNHIVCIGLSILLIYWLSP